MTHERCVEGLVLRLVSFAFGFVAGLMVGGDLSEKHHATFHASCPHKADEVKSVGTAYQHTVPVHTSSATKEAP